MAGHQRPLFVLYGASLTEFAYQPGGWGASLTDYYARKDHPIQPSLVVVSFGANDLAFPLPSGKGQHVPINEYKSNLRQICAHLKGLSDTTRVIVITPPPIFEDVRRAYARSRWGRYAGNYLDRTNEHAGEYSETCVQVAKEMDLGIINLWESIQRTKNWERECLSDGMHLSPIGNQILLEELLKVLKNANWVPNLHWESLPDDYDEPSMYDYVHPSQELAAIDIQESEQED